MEIATHYGMLIISGLLVVVAAVLATPTKPDQKPGDGQAKADDS